MLYVLGEELYLPKEIEALAEQQQEEHMESSEKEGMIREFLERPVPENWDSVSLPNRRMFWNGDQKEGTVLVPREKVCAAEIWAECFNADMKFMKKSDSVEINAILSRLKGWRRNKDKRRYGPYGPRRGFERSTPIG